jgi:hypothetical protein
VFDDSSWPAGATGIGYQTSVPGFAVYNYIAAIGTCSLSDAQSVINNPSQQIAVYTENASVLNYLNTGGSANYGNDATFPGMNIGADQDNFALHATATITIPAPGNWTFGVNSDDGFTLSIGGFTMAYPNPRAPVIHCRPSISLLPAIIPWISSSTNAVAGLNWNSMRQKGVSVPGSHELPPCGRCR